MMQKSESQENRGPVRNEKLMLASCATTIATLIPVALFQTGVLRSLPDPPSSLFDSDNITQSKIAHPFGIPDALLGLASFGTTFSLILLARKSRTAKDLLGAKLTLDASAAAFNATRQIISFGKLCSWCTGTALAAGVMAFAGRKKIVEAFEKAKASATQARALVKRATKLPLAENSSRSSSWQSAHEGHSFMIIVQLAPSQRRDSFNDTGKHRRLFNRPEPPGYSLQ